MRGQVFIDVLLVAALGLTLFFVGAAYEGFEMLYEVSRAHEEWDLDELIIGFFAAGVAGLVFFIRRSVDLAKEIRLRNAAERENAWLADHDQLTGLANRRSLESYIQRIEPSAVKTEDGVLIIFLVDLDGFKAVNDLLGHRSGDVLLKEVAKRLQTSQRDGFHARLGGDEFVIIARLRDLNAAAEVAQDLAHLLCEPVMIDGAEARVGASVGYAALGVDAMTMAELLRAADVAMYAAKRDGLRAARRYEPSMGDLAAQRAKIEWSLREALLKETVRPHFQPYVDIRTGAVRGFEVLARWTRDDGESVAPSSFIPLAEELGLITELSDMLLREACREAREWPGAPKLSFNLAPTQLVDRDLARRVARIVEAEGFPAARLEMELTETAVAPRLEAAVETIADLRAIGITIALDDYGSANSSVARLAKLDLDTIKIDNALIWDAATNEKTQNILKSILAMADDLGIDTVAEGVECPSQRDLLRRMGCRAAQGFLFGAAMTADDVRAALQRDAAIGQV